MSVVLQPRNPIVRSTLADAVYETLLEAILSGRLPGGAELSVVAVAKELDVSRTPVHEAIRHLARDGLVRLAVNRKARIVSFTERDVFEIFAMRKILEGAAAERAASRIRPGELARLDATAEALGASPRTGDWFDRWIDFDEDFHATVGAASGVARLTQDIGRYRLLHRVFNRVVTNVECLQQALREHLEILDALHAGDPPRARRAMQSHIDVWQDYFVRNFPGKAT